MSGAGHLCASVRLHFSQAASLASLQLASLSLSLPPPLYPPPPPPSPTSLHGRSGGELCGLRGGKDAVVHINNERPQPPPPDAHTHTKHSLPHRHGDGTSPALSPRERCGWIWWGGGGGNKADLSNSPFTTLITSSYAGLPYCSLCTLDSC